MGNGGTGGFVDNGGGTGSGRECKQEVGDIVRREQVEAGKAR